MVNAVCVINNGTCVNHNGVRVTINTDGVMINAAWVISNGAGVMIHRLPAETPDWEWPLSKKAAEPPYQRRLFQNVEFQNSAR